MKKSFLVLSALLTLVVSGICLQSCSSEYEEYSTEEYGYYTEEEIAQIMALAEKYDLDIEIKYNNYTKKKPLSDFEAKFQAISQIKGRYEMIPTDNNDEKGNSICKRVDMPVSRTAPSSFEKGSWSKNKIVSVQKTDDNGRPYYANYNIAISIDWDLTTSGSNKNINASIEISDLTNVEGEIYANFAGLESISFSGKIKGDDIDERYNIITYKFNIKDGNVNRRIGIGDFIIE